MNSQSEYERLKLISIDNEIARVTDSLNAFNKVFTEVHAKKLNLEARLNLLKEEKQDLIDGQMSISDFIEL